MAGGLVPRYVLKLKGILELSSSKCLVEGLKGGKAPSPPPLKPGAYSVINWAPAQVVREQFTGNSDINTANTKVVIWLPVCFPPLRPLGRGLVVMWDRFLAISTSLDQSFQAGELWLSFGCVSTLIPSSLEILIPSVLGSAKQSPGHPDSGQSPETVRNLSVDCANINNFHHCHDVGRKRSAMLPSTNIFEWLPYILCLHSCHWYKLLNSSGSRTKTQPPETLQQVDIEPFINTTSIHLNITPPKELSI